MRSGLERVGRLAPGSGFAEVTAGVVAPWSGALDAYVRAELGWHPTESLSAFAFAQAGLQGAQAGVGGRLRF